MKVCTKCKIEKPLTEYHNCSSKKDGKFSACKTCRNTANKAYGERVGHDVLYRNALNKDPDAYRKRSADYYQKNKERIKANVRDRAKRNPEKIKAARKKDYELNKERYIKNAVKWNSENVERRREIAQSHHKRKRLTPTGKAEEASRKMLSRVLELTGKRKTTRTEQAIGYSKQDLVTHMERQFLDGMSWDNHGEWHIDHILPISEMVALGVTCPKKVNALSNLRPVWAQENLSKGNRFELSAPAVTRISL